MDPRIIDKIKITSEGHWLWTAATDRDGYGRIRDGNRVVSAHRYTWEKKIGPAPRAKCIANICGKRECVNPEHLKLMSKREVLLRGDTIPAKHHNQKTCKRGHPFTYDNTYRYHGERRCKTCQRDRAAIRRLRSYKDKGNIQ